MARLTAQQWEQARADYEVRGISLGEVAKQFGVVTSSVSRKARNEGWVQGKMQDLIERKVAAAKEMVEVQTQTQELPLRFQHTVESVVQERLQAEGFLASLDVALASRGAAIAQGIGTPGEWEIMTRGRKNLAPERNPGGVNVNVSQGQSSQTAILPLPSPKPDDAIRDVLRGKYEGDGE